MNTCNFLFVNGPNVGRKCGKPGVVLEGKKIRCDACQYSSWPKQQIHPCVNIKTKGKYIGTVCGKNTRFSDLVCSVCRKA